METQQQRSVYASLTNDYMFRRIIGSEEYIIEMQLARFDKTGDGLETYYDKWMYLFKNMSKLKVRPESKLLRLPVCLL